ncbi:hypothetical protein CHUAL_006094 [Chamberlinius hualienensis]
MISALKMDHIFRRTVTSSLKLGSSFFRSCQISPPVCRLLSSSTGQQQPQELPRLPVPTLKQTLEKYLQTVEPHLTNQQFENTKRLVNEFGKTGGIGEKLQDQLVKRYNESDNWLAEWWLKYSYLSYRQPLIIFSSPGMVMPKFECKNFQDMIVTAARVILAALNYKQTVDEGRLPLEMMGKAPLDMSQHGLMLGTCRIPFPECDILTYLPKNNPPKHVIVAHNNHFVKVDVYDNQGLPYSEEVLIDVIKEAVDKSSHPAVPIGILTAENRDTWAKVYKELRQNKKNAESLAEIQKSLFLVCFDQPNLSGNINPPTNSALQMIHGGGSTLNGGNRWYDKTVQFIVGSNGELGISYEHSPAEGPPVANLSDAAVDSVFGQKLNLKFSPLTKATNSPTRLDFELTDNALNSVTEAKQHLDKLVANLDMACFVFEPYGKNYIKSQKLSPDSFIQMALQLAFYRLHGVVGAAYETASTRMYLHGRTETIRSASTQSLWFCKAMLDDKSTDEAKRKALHVAVETHKRYVAEAIKGYGVDRHLLGLKLLALENNLAVPEIFKDVGYEKSSSFRLSTSQAFDFFSFLANII